jgi:hypothetical protein
MLLCLRQQLLCKSARNRPGASHLPVYMHDYILSKDEVVPLTVRLYNK